MVCSFSLIQRLNWSFLDAIAFAVLVALTTAPSFPTSIIHFLSAVLKLPPIFFKFLSKCIKHHFHRLLYKVCSYCLKSTKAPFRFIFRMIFSWASFSFPIWTFFTRLFSSTSIELEWIFNIHLKSKGDDRVIEGVPDSFDFSIMVVTNVLKEDNQGRIHL